MLGEELIIYKTTFYVKKHIPYPSTSSFVYLLSLTWKYREYPIFDPGGQLLFIILTLSLRSSNLVYSTLLFVRLLNVQITKRTQIP